MVFQFFEIAMTVSLLVGFWFLLLSIAILSNSTLDLELKERNNLLNPHLNLPEKTECRIT